MNSKQKCKECKEYFDSGLDSWVKFNFGRFHKFECADKFAGRRLKKVCAENKVKEKKAWGKRKEKLQGIRHQEKLTQKVVNWYVRLRDAYFNRACISCQRTINYESNASGGACDAGHYKTQKAHPELRFNVNNINAECKHCNHYNTEHLVGMRKGIAYRYGQERLDWLDGHHKLKNYTIEDHKRIRKLANKRAKRYTR